MVRRRRFTARVRFAGTDTWRVPMPGAPEGSGVRRRRTEARFLGALAVDLLLGVVSDRFLDCNRTVGSVRPVEPDGGDWGRGVARGGGGGGARQELGRGGGESG